MTALPALTRINDRTYQLADGDTGNLRAYLDGISAKHTRVAFGDQHLHRWLIDNPAGGRSVVTLFESGRLVVLGPRVAALDELAGSEVPA